MKRGILARQSRAAGWCRLIGALALPVLVLAALGSRGGIVPGPAIVPVVALGFSLGLLALAIGAFALTDIWRTGAEGAGSAVAGIIYAFPVLLILAAVAIASVVYPRLTDVSTDLADPPPLERRAGAGLAQLSPDQAELQSEAFPDIAPRLYGASAAVVYGAVRGLAENRGWEIVGDVPPLSVPAEPGVVPGEPAAAEARGTGMLHIVATTPVFGFADDVTVRLQQTPAGTRVDMRSASRTGMHDLGQNARRVRGFFAELDAALQPDPNAPPSPGPVIAAPVPEAGSDAAGPAIE